MRQLLCASFVLASLLLATTNDALACGGCFIPPLDPEKPDGGTVVTSHRMALSISPDQTILWDQIQYAGSPAEFAWVLPVKPGARVEVSSDAWFDVLDAATGTLVHAPQLDCGSSTSFFGCSVGAPGASMGCGSDGEAALLPGEDPDPVSVVSHGSSGPYEVVILRSEEPGALVAWLEEHSYDIPDDIHPLIESYVGEGFDFVALRLLPAVGVQQMRPVRVVQPGAVTTLPLRMVAAGTGARTAISLFVIGEGRYTTKNFPEVDFPDLLVSWDYESSSSNYATLRDSMLDLQGGNVFFAPYAVKGALFSRHTNPVTNLPVLYETTNGWVFPTAGEAFAEQAFVNGETSTAECGAALQALATEQRRVVLPCDDEGNCSLDSATEIDANTLMCPPPIGSDRPLDDLAQALVGMHPRDVWITRLEANLPREAFAEDLVLVPAQFQEEREGSFEAEIQRNPPCDQPPPAPTLFAAPKKPGGAGEAGKYGLALTVGAFAGIALLRRRMKQTLTARSLQARQVRA
jgi:hypothetical protein